VTAAVRTYATAASATTIRGRYRFIGSSWITTSSGASARRTSPITALRRFGWALKPERLTYRRRADFGPRGVCASDNRAAGTPPHQARTHVQIRPPWSDLAGGAAARLRVRGAGRKGAPRVTPRRAFRSRSTRSRSWCPDGRAERSARCRTESSRSACCRSGKTGLC